VPAPSPFVWSVRRRLLLTAMPPLPVGAQTPLVAAGVSRVAAQELSGPIGTSSVGRARGYSASGSTYQGPVQWNHRGRGEPGEGGRR